METNISKANDLPKEFNDALNKWRISFKREAKENDISWFSKLVSTTFEYNNKYYRVTIYDVCDEEVLRKTPHNILEAILEIMQSEITADLINLGATNIRNFGGNCSNYIKCVIICFIIITKHKYCTHKKYK